MDSSVIGIAKKNPFMVAPVISPNFTKSWDLGVTPTLTWNPANANGHGHITEGLKINITETHLRAVTTTRVFTTTGVTSIPIKIFVLTLEGTDVNSGATERISVGMALAFTHNSGTVILSDTAAGGWNLGGDGNFNGTNSFYNLSISGSVVNVSSNYLNVENDFTCIHNTANPASYGYQWRPYNGSTTIQGDLILKESGSGWPCSFGNYYIAGAGYTANTTIYGNVIMGSGTTLALTTSGSKTFELYGSFINNGGEVLVF